ncbi:MAG: DUF4258 domain-containing protein [Taibaiella sp.]|nr:DUF4258 domain-containing protein [Taibaiella sp.]
MKRRSNRYSWKLWIAALAVTVIAIWSYEQGGSEPENIIPRDISTADLKISKHAACRMDCRHISRDEILEVLKEGRMNRSKTRADERGSTYAYEGRTKDGQEVRIIVAPYKDNITIVTVIDLRNEWNCDC